MIRSLMIAKTGLEAQQTNMDVISNNIANVSTIGFKRQKAIFEDLLYQTIRQPGAKSSEQTTIPSGLQLGTGVRPVATKRIHSQGGLINTGNPTDLAIEGAGFLQVLMPDGTTAYTRDGSLQFDQYGQLVTSSGYPIQPAIIIPHGASNLTISKDGLVSVMLPGQSDPQEVGQLTLVTFINDTGLQSLGENLYYETASSGEPIENKPSINGTGSFKQQFLENSNVNVAQELIAMIQVQRAYELNSKAISTSDQMLQKLAQI